MSALGIPIDTEKSEISSALNACLLLAFGMGMYTVIYFGTMYIYLKKNSSKRPIVPAIITVQFLCNVVQTGLQWYATKWQFVDNGDTRDSVFVSLFDTPNWSSIVGSILVFTCFVLADVLLIWRCFFVWNRSFRVISMPLLLLIIEIGLFLFVITYLALNGEVSTNAAIVNMFNNFACAAYFTTSATSLLTTVLIAYRIYSASRQGIFNKKFTRIINIVSQSGAMYSLALLVTAIASVLPGGQEVGSAWGIALRNYITVLVTIIAGISTTILIARSRVSLLPTNFTFPSTSVHISDLQFHSHSTRQTDTLEGMEAGHPVGIDSNSMSGGLQIDEKDQ